MKYAAFLGSALLLVLSLGCTPKYTQPELGARKVNILTEGKFLYMNSCKICKISLSF